MDRYLLPQLGEIIVSESSTDLSIGLLDLNPGKELAKHNRPVDEELLQVHGSCVMKLYESNGVIKEVVLHKGESLTIPANQYHIHSNPTDGQSLTLWKFPGDITEVIAHIRQNFPKAE